jgi:hypothetical protein
MTKKDKEQGKQTRQKNETKDKTDKQQTSE